MHDVALAMNIGEPLIEKDYYLTLFLKGLTVQEPLLVFKGGTCLSKCFKLVKRFSEDVDINLEGASNLTPKRRKLFKQHIINAIDAAGLELTNLEETRSGRDHNLYKIAYPVAFESEALKQRLEVETYFLIDSFPNVEMPVSSMIYDHLKEGNLEDVIAEFDLQPFNIRVQSLQRTFVDKIFALCDYYLGGRTEKMSRHLYDIHKILPHMSLDDDMRNFIEEIRRAREGKRDCLSAGKNFSLPDAIERIIAEKVYKNDYDLVTSVLLYESAPYGEVIGSLKKIADWLKH